MARAHLNKVSKRRSIIERLTWTFCGKYVRIVDLAEVKLSQVWSFITAALPKSESTVRDAIYGVQGRLSC